MSGLPKRFSDCFTSHHNPELIEHTLESLIRQRIFGLALEYEDLNDHEYLKSDPLLATVSGKEDATDDPLHEAQEGRFFHGYYRSYC